MKRSAYLVLLPLFLLTSPARADTVRLKNGRVIHGQVLRYGNGEFVILADSTGEGSDRERILLLADSVESIVFDSAPAPPSTAPPATAPKSTSEGTIVVVSPDREFIATGIQVREGEQVRIGASGEIRLGDGRRTGPAGLAGQEPLLPFPGEPLGALVAMVGSPQSPAYRVIGEQADFQARTSGELFLQINARTLAGVSGSYTARVRTGSQPATGGAAPTPSTGPAPSRPLHQEISVPADRAWTDTGIDLREGDALHLSAQGTIHYTSSKTCGPTGGGLSWRELLRPLPVSDAGRGALIALVGEVSLARPFNVGERGEFVVERNGRLFLGINDDQFEDNQGSFKAQIEIVPGRQ
jgi:hypothetical protein